jgi:hypothetical protein
VIKTRSADGYGIICDPSLPRSIECDTVQCGHCGGHVRVKPGSGLTVYLLPTAIPGSYREEMGCWCGKCSTPICLGCHQRGRCTPFELWLDRQEKTITSRLGWGRFYKYVTGG